MQTSVEESAVKALFFSLNEGVVAGADSGICSMCREGVSESLVKAG